MAQNKISRPYDARAQRSRESLRTALLYLITQKPFEQISIRDITAEAGVSYPTFFRQFSAKEELLEDIAEEEIHRLFALAVPVFEQKSHYASMCVFCNYVNNNRRLWKVLLTAGASEVMRGEFVRIAKEVGGRARERPNSWLPLDLAAQFVVSGIFEIIAWWMSQPDDYPVERVMRIFDALVVLPLTNPIELPPA
jgi:AcrR family transcriptional regulator